MEALSNKRNTLINVASDLNTQIKNLENECSSLLTAIKLIYCDREDYAAPESVKNLPDSDQSVFSNDSYEPPNVSVIDLENTKENESVKQNSVLAESKRKGKTKQTKKKSKSVSGLVQTSNFSCAESNVNELSSLFELICIRFGT